jgi:hypothetical protein
MALGKLERASLNPILALEDLEAAQVPAIRREKSDARFRTLRIG